MKRLMMALALVALVGSMVPSVVSAATAKVKVKTECKGGGWQDLVDENGEPFGDKKDCTAYVREGGVPLPEGILVVAYTNVDGEPGFGASDVLIARLVDTDGNGLDPGDRLEMGRYPTSFSAPYEFAAWGAQSHAVTSLVQGGDGYSFRTAAGWHSFLYSFQGHCEGYEETLDNPEVPSPYAQFLDGIDSWCDDHIEVEAGAPSSPTTTVLIRRTAAQSHAFIDVDFFD